MTEAFKTIQFQANDSYAQIQQISFAISQQNESNNLVENASLEINEKVKDNSRTIDSNNNAVENLNNYVVNMNSLMEHFKTKH